MHATTSMRQIRSLGFPHPGTHDIPLKVPRSASHGYPQFQLPPSDGFIATHFLVVSDQDRSRDFYNKVFGPELCATVTR